ncbi:MAG: trehalose-phosphatase [Phycisphaerae bacterium]|nr:trehalose-phosphatase [Phycisphaerae bacterium]
MGDIAELAATQTLLIASDFDGVLADIAPAPDDVVADSRVMDLLSELALLPRTYVAIISGRDLSTLRALTGDRPWLHLVGSHGSEGEFIPPYEWTESDRALLEHLGAWADSFAAKYRGVLVEHKPFGAAVHYRAAAQEAVLAELRAFTDECRVESRATVRDGMMVREFTVGTLHKGDALEFLRARLGASNVIALGDDRTDEDMFGVLGRTDLCVHVGRRPTIARHRLLERSGVVDFMNEVLKQRRTATAIADVRIDHHALLSDQRAIALSDPLGRITWLCAPRPESPPLFGVLVGGEGAGSFDVHPDTGPREGRLTYEPNSMIARLQWPNVTLTDYIDCSAGRPFQRPGRSELVRVVEGTGKVRVRFAPRPDFGRAAVRLRVHDRGIELLDVVDPIVLHAPAVHWTMISEGRHQVAIGEADLGADPLVFQLRCGAADFADSQTSETRRRDQTRTFWSAWLGSLQVPALYAEHVKRSALALKALAHGPTGAFLAAGTTSLPEEIGGVRNWDYRYCWPRDSALAATALARLGNTGHAMRLTDWLLGVLGRCESAERMRPIYSVSGGDLAGEGEVGGIAGYARSVPVRIGNAASLQVQLDVFGPIVEMVSVMAERGAVMSSEHWQLVETMVAAVARRWREPDHGIWELRMAPRQHVYSKVMAWLTVDRGLRVAEQFLGHAPAGWSALRSDIADDVTTHGWSRAANAFTTAYGSDDLDAAALHVGLSGLLPPDDPSFHATVRAIERGLRSGPTVLRYRFDDGLPGLEGGFFLCAFWLVESYVLLGELDNAHAFMREIVALIGSTGLMSEEYCPRLQRSLGNYPQAYSHAGLINAAVRLALV